MRGILLVGAALLALGTPALAQQEGYVTVRQRLMCKTQQSLREAMKAVEQKDRNLMRTIQGCRTMIPDIPVTLVQDNVSMVKIRFEQGPADQREEYWTLPDSIRQTRR